MTTPELDELLWFVSDSKELLSVSVRNYLILGAVDNEHGYLDPG